MSHHWLIITFSWFGSVSLQYINTGGPGANVGLDSMDRPQYPIPYINYNSPSTRVDFDTLQTDPLNEQYYQRDDVLTEIQRKRRLMDEKEEVRDKRYAPNLVDTDKTELLQNEDQATPYVHTFTSVAEENATANEIFDTMEKKYFSPWGGKRDKHNMEHMWTWKRSNNVREPSMPKRVRFSPWGGKRSGQLILKPGFHYIPIFDKRLPIKFFAVGSGANGRRIRQAMPFKTFFETLPKFFKPGHPYLDVNLKKDGKRKVKFSAWGGKRSPPIIGPIWTPTNDNMKDSTLNTIIILRNIEEEEKGDNRMSKAS